MHPRETLSLLGELESIGFTDEAFRLLHHFRRRTNNHRLTIAAFRSYCEKTSAFRPDHNNERVQRRLRMVFDNYRQAGFGLGQADKFKSLAEAAFLEIPPV
jgi:hypothetical protein